MLSRPSCPALSMDCPWTVACQAALSVGHSRQGYWSGLPFPPPGDLLERGIKCASLASPALAVDSVPLGPLGSPFLILVVAAAQLLSRV